MPDEYNYNVFINCPFDNEFSPLFDASLFAIYKCGFRPRCAMEEDNAAGTRIEKIERIIRDCRFGVHDISRTELDEGSQLPRFNMPLELGMFLGAKKYGSGRQKDKIAIIFDREQYRYQQFISDIAGQDIKSHEGIPINMIRKIRNSLNNSGVNGAIVGANVIIDSYEAYEQRKPSIIDSLGFDPDDLTYSDKTSLIEEWLTITS